MKAFRLALLILSAVVTLVLLVYFYQHRDRHLAPLPVLGQLASFSLTDQDSKVFSDTDLRGHIAVVDFIFTRCQGQCPILSQTLVALQQALGSSRQLHLVSISIDPENDTPQALSAYAHRLKANRAYWHFLTGARADIKTLLVKGLKIGSEDDPNMHSTYFVLLDPQQRIRGYYDGLDRVAVKKLYRDVKQLGAETPL